MIWQKVTALCFCVLFSFCTIPLYAQSDSTDIIESEINQDEYPERYKSREVWEHVLSFPGTLVNLPFKIVLSGVGGTVGIIYKSKIVDKINDFLTSDDNLRALRPIYSSRSGAGLKLYQKDILNRNSKAEISTSAGHRYRQKYHIALSGINLFRESVHADISVGYHLYPDEGFYGIGPNSIDDDDNESNYSYEQSSIRFGLGSKLKDKFDLSALLTIENNSILDGKDYDDISTMEMYSITELPGLESEVWLIGTEVRLSCDSRDIQGNPSSGREILLEGGIFRQIENHNYSFWKASLDIKQYIHLFYGRSIILRIAGEMTEPLSDKAIPFYYLSELGRSETIRGFSRGRFRDRDMLFGSIEYRYPIMKKRQSNIDAFLFIDAGQVTADIINDIELDDIQIGFGGGVRLWSSESESLKLFVGKSKEQFRFYIEMNQ